jgi:hypothetical protein
MIQPKFNSAETNYKGHIQSELAIESAFDEEYGRLNKHFEGFEKFRSVQNGQKIRAFKRRVNLTWQGVSLILFLWLHKPQLSSTSSTFDPQLTHLKITW